MAGFLHLSSQHAERVEIRAVDFHGDLRGNATEHVAEAVADGLADVGEGSWNGGEFLADFGEDFGTGASVVVEFHVEFIDGDRHDVVILFRPPGAASSDQTSVITRAPALKIDLSTRISQLHGHG